MRLDLGSKRSRPVGLPCTMITIPCQKRGLEQSTLLWRSPSRCHAETPGGHDFGVTSGNSVLCRKGMI